MNITTARVKAITVTLHTAAMKATMIITPIWLRISRNGSGYLL
ncbi:hypothetical protein APU01nite_19530 [Alkalibacterium putridalgicola]|uniref:Uncharacterized protein n=1 Tax=Alkalibacterium putridalgicola TaxID=426703 RepID=A0ABQ0UZI1_9LACT|nr:hypothetical protein APU01nite_19530 [Alkalibacterium putridalgicola]